MEKELKQFFKGLKRQLATAQDCGEGQVKVGKDPLSFELYEFLSSHLLELPGSDAIFARVYLVISWNLMCRSANAFGVRHSHIEWGGDSLRVYFAHMKNDQGGDRPRDPRHVYANPLQPSVCPILALAIYWATSTFDVDNRLFPGSDQYDRFRKSLHRLLEDDRVSVELTQVISVLIQCAKGQPHTVRLVLPLVHHLRRCTCEQAGLWVVFRTHIYAMRLQGICMSGELLLDCLLTAMSLLYCLRTSWSKMTGGPNSKLKATGLPPHVSILSQMKELQNKTLPTIEEIEEVRHEIVKNIVREFEDRAISARTVTYDGLQDARRNCLAEVDIHDLVDKHNAIESPTVQNSTSTDDRVTPSTFFCAGRFRRVPSDFVLPECSVANLWDLWRCGNAEKQLPPLCMLDGVDMPNSNSQKRLSDARYLMKNLEAIGTTRNLLRRRQTVEEVVRVDAASSSAVEVPLTTAHARMRRRRQLTWVSVVRLHRIADRATRS
ncbi:hypothetical protein PPTG_19954 [Phytophthora nicotianae INRA-310]|uniref:Uncharacterized protein n=1 Tax=Phytophthora nicotianae (strain INRA-310) TaxID=761204 RepID=W2PB49_PHYN3|nr:hypothetical protein PPTG_19954 [Phytophthora nicotianae INRA-310]ETM97880.1 hypothetical protein PPTG_19954 [Phytophthora nicotianae INRA-310]